MSRPAITLCTILLLLIPIIGNTEQIESNGNVEVFFLHRGGAAEPIIKEINFAKSEILMQTKSFTDKPISQALVDARKRGVKIVTIMDKGQEKDKNTLLDLIHKAGIPVFFDLEHALDHNKIIIIDRITLITGSFDFTKTENNNVENLLILKGNKLLVDIYIKNLEEHRGHSENYKGN